MIELNEKLEELIETKDFVILLFGTQDCGVCSVLKNRLDAWLETYPHVTSRYISIEKHSQQCAQFQIYSAPALYVYVEQKPMIQVAGTFSLDQQLQQLERIVSIYNQ